MIARSPRSTTRWHFPWLSDSEIQRIFSRPPAGVALTASPRTLGVGLGATIYVPARRPNLVSALHQAAECGAVAAVVCLEDSIATEDLQAAEQNLSMELSGLNEATKANLPMLWVRPRTPDHLEQLATRYRDATDRIAGACLPKFNAAGADAWFDSLALVGETLGRPFLAMPILEGPEVLHIETRTTELLELRAILARHSDVVVAARVGGTDLCGLLGLRRSIDETIYDLAPLRSCIADIVNVLGRADEGLVISGPVWEYFDREPRMWKPQLRESLFVDVRGNATRSQLRSSLIKQHLDGLIKEAVADRANGLSGKTVIHPSHVLTVNALAVPTFEEWVDATSVVSSRAGAIASRFSNKMNETRPHASWAARVIDRADVFGVLAEGVSFVDLIDA